MGRKHCKLSWKRCTLVRSAISGLFVNTLSTDDSYSLNNRKNLMQLIQMQMSKKEFFRPSEIDIKFKKYYPHSLSISEIIDSGRRTYLNV